VINEQLTAASDATAGTFRAMTNKPRQFWFIGVLACIVLLVIGLVVTLFHSGLHVVIQNTGSQPLRSVVLHVTGASYSLGDILPGATAHATVHPASESHLEIDFTDPTNKTERLDAGGYFEPGYRGTIDISIKDGVIEMNEQDIRLPWSLP